MAMPAVFHLASAPATFAGLPGSQWKNMRIISSDGKDYYESAQAYGHDERLVYLRQEQIFKLPRSPHQPDTLPPELKFVLPLAKSCPSPIDLRPGWPVRQISVNPGWVLFAGKLYLFALVTQLNAGDAAAQEHFFYSYEELASYLLQFGCDLGEKRALWHRPEKLTWGAFFAQVGDSRYYDSCALARAPVLRYYQGTAELGKDSLLAPYKFFKVLDTWQAYQELSMFVGMLGSPEKPVVVIEDKYRVTQHGFDEWSFRKLPSKKT